MRIGPSTRRILWILAAYKVFYWLLIFICLAVFPRFENGHYDHCLHWPREGPPTLGSQLATWDAAHYLLLAETGYQRGSPSCAFYPLWPALVKAGSWLTGGNLLVSGLLLANLLSVLALTLFHYFVQRYHGEETANLALILLLAFPGAIFFNFIYTESLFLLLVMLFFIFLLRQNYLGLAIVGFLLPLTKAIGVFCLVPLVWATLSPILSRRRTGEADSLAPLGERAGLPSVGLAKEGVRGNGTSEHPTLTTNASTLDEAQTQPSTRDRSNLKFSILNSQFAIPPLLSAWCLLMGYAAYFLVIWLLTGNPFEGFIAQRNYPNQPSIGNIVNLLGVWRAFTNAGSFHGSMDSILDRGFFVLFLVSLYGIWRLNKVYFFYALFAGAIPALSTWFFSYSRNVMMCFPLFIAAAHFLLPRERRWALWYYVLILAVLQCFFLVQYLNFRWAG